MKALILLTFISISTGIFGQGNIAKTTASEKKVICGTVSHEVLRNGVYVFEKYLRCDTLIEINGNYNRVICDSINGDFVDEQGNEITVGRIYRCDTITVFLPYEESSIQNNADLAQGKMTIIFDTLKYEDNGKKVFEIYKSEGALKDGLKVGFWKTYYSNGELSESTAYKIIKKGELILDRNDYLKEDSSGIKMYKEDKYSIQVGPYISYYRNGKTNEFGNYSNTGRVYRVSQLDYDPEGNEVLYDSWSEPKGIKVGVWQTFNEKGEIESKLDYKYGISGSEELPTK